MYTDVGECQPARQLSGDGWTGICRSPAGRIFPTPAGSLRGLGVGYGLPASRQAACRHCRQEMPHFRGSAEGQTQPSESVPRIRAPVSRQTAMSAALASVQNSPPEAPAFAADSTIAVDAKAAAKITHKEVVARCSYGERRAGLRRPWSRR